ncbi:MAG: hypothetical protein NC390_06700 [Fusobacterium sp.]|nr:hypothetical protein [Fusobacterium sp.]
MRKFIFTILGITILTQSSLACEISEDSTFKKVLDMRNTAQIKLNLTPEQEQKRQQINSNYNPKFYSIIREIDQLSLRLGNGEIYTIEQINDIKDAFEIKENELFTLNQEYEKEFKSNLTLSQRIYYSHLKRQNRRILKKELNEEILKNSRPL